MMSTNNQLDPMILAACAAKTYNAHHLMAYAQLNQALEIVQISPNFSQMALEHPLPEERIVGQLVIDILWEFVGATDSLQQILEGKSSLFRLEHVNREQPDGTLRYLTFLAYNLEQEVGSPGLLLLVEDSTEYGRLHHELVQDRNELRLLQRQLADANEALTKLNRMKSLFLSMAAHDLRTPLSAIKGYSEMLLLNVAQPGTEKSYEYLDIIHHQSGRLNQLIDDIVDLDIIEQGQLKIELIACDLNDILQEAITALKFNLERRNISLIYNPPPEPLILWVDSEKLLRVLYNLIGNAIKYIHSQGTITIHIGRTENNLTIEIEDNGPGMTASQLDKLFSLYYRTEDAESSQVPGTGLGLFIVKTMVEAHDGTIRVTSQPNFGTKFTIQLPINSGHN
jgi:signal transduction histidine kinase